MKVEILSRELIKPYTATPSFRNYRLSLMDELAPNMNAPTMYYYSAPDQDTSNDTTLRFKHLKNSLSKALSSFYPFAGRYRIYTHSVDCGDQGAEFVQAKVDIRLDDLVSQRMNVLAVQVNAQWVQLMATTILYLQYNAWAIATKQELGEFDAHIRANDPQISNERLEFLQKSEFKSWFKQKVEHDVNYELFKHLIDGPCIPAGLGREKENFELYKIVTKMFYFDKSKISSIRERARLDDSSLLPSKVQSISGLIGKAIIDVHVANPENPNTYTIIQAVNIRKRTVPPLPDNQFGNLYILSSFQSAVGPERVASLATLVNYLSKSVKGVVDACTTVLSPGKESQTMISHGVYELMNSLSDPNMFLAASISSWSKFPYYDLADFGWGKPVWFGVPNICWVCGV
ncbi:hypothetical protein POM88_034184 [Heracleum sosnowskyi]|uniref:Uncharacterized protein n=1 Tax=Heracleum sosnowskyi TaxID=360622 RepID=A0AAD8HIS1_9APIA|nr:hypothetical protein POM88_034184 [Heracleum sosnowskyi]